MKSIYIAMIFLFLSMNFVQAQTDNKIRLKHFNLKKNLAIKGYDPVAYHTENKARKGNREVQYTYHEVIYRFVNQNHLELFKQSPEKYEPAYGGWCAYAMGDNGKKVSINPKTFKITNGKLYLFYNRFFINTLKKWNKNPEILKKKADQYWEKIIK